MEDIVLLQTSSLSRNVGSSTVPNYEDFQDRFSHAKSPFVISPLSSHNILYLILLL